MPTFGQKLRELREAKGLNQGELAKRVGLTRPLISMWENDKARPSLEAVQKLERIFGQNLFTVLDKENAPVNVPLDQVNRGPIIPIYDSISAGGFTLADGQAKEHIAVDASISSKCFALRIKGDSMSPLFSEGDIVVVDPDLSPRNGDCVIATQNDHAATLKEYRLRGIDPQGNQVFDLIPLNPVYPTITINRENPGQVIGVVVEHRRYVRRSLK